MKPTETWKKNNWRYDLRQYTRIFEKKFKEKKSKKLTESGKIYATVYKSSSNFPTDKHHITPILISFGRFKDESGKTYVRGFNLLFLKPYQALEILEDIYSIHKFKIDDRAIRMIKLHEKYIRIYPYLFKNYEEDRIVCQSEVLIEEWGMIPLLQKNLWGTFNPTALNEDFQKENLSVYKKEKKKIKKVQEKSEEDVEEYVLDDFSEESEDTLVDSD